MNHAALEPPDHLSDWFWQLVAAGGGDAGLMREILATISVRDLLRFHYELEDAVCEFQDERFAEYLTTASEDGAIDVAYWVVSQGRAYYHEVFAHPAQIPADVEGRQPGALHDGITLTVYHERTGDYPPYRED